MVLLDQIWDDVVAGPRPDHGLANLKKINTKGDGESGEGSSTVLRSLSMPSSPSAPSTPLTPTTPTTPSPTARRDNVWRSVFSPGMNPNTKGMGSDFYDKPAQPNSPTVYDWLYSGKTRSKHHH